MAALSVPVQQEMDIVDATRGAPELRQRAFRSSEVDEVDISSLVFPSSPPVPKTARVRPRAEDGQDIGDDAMVPGSPTPPQSPSIPQEGVGHSLQESSGARAVRDTTDAPGSLPHAQAPEHPFTVPHAASAVAQPRPLPRDPSDGLISLTELMFANDTRYNSPGQSPILAELEGDLGSSPPREPGATIPFRSSTAAVRHVSFDGTPRRQAKVVSVAGPAGANVSLFPGRRAVSGISQVNPLSRSLATSSEIRLIVVGSGSRKQRRTSVMTIPQPGAASVSAQDAEKPMQTIQHYFDDQAFAQALRSQYYRLVGKRYHFLSARKLTSIAVTGAFSEKADRAYGWLALASTNPEKRSASDRSTQEGAEICGIELMQLLDNPRSGRGRYAWVGWARQIAEAVAVSSPATRVSSLPASPSSIRHFSLQRATSVERPYLAAIGAQTLSPRRVRGPPRGNQHAEEKVDDKSEGLEFVLGWCVRRIAGAFAGVVLLACLVALIWIFLGPTQLPWTLGSADLAIGLGSATRVTSGLVLGAFVLTLGLAVWGLWLFLSAIML